MQSFHNSSGRNAIDSILSLFCYEYFILSTLANSTCSYQGMCSLETEFLVYEPCKVQADKIHKLTSAHFLSPTYHRGKLVQERKGAFLVGAAVFAAPRFSV